AELNGIPAIRRVVIPHPIADLEEPELLVNIKNVFGTIVDSLTSPLTTEEQKTGMRQLPKRNRIVFEGTVEEVQDKFIELEVSDGAPIIPPTEELVNKMLQETDRDPQEILGKMPPENLVVTVEKIAINGVMAGCSPEYMPVLLAVAEALMDPKLGVAAGARSTNSFAYWGFANGPFAEKIGINSKANALGPGNKANTTIGRAIRLFITSLGGSRVGVNDMSSVGNPFKFGFFFAENEKDSPWTPFHVDKDYNPEESTVTLFMSFGGFRASGRNGKGGIDLVNLVERIKSVESAGGPNSGMVILFDPLLAKQCVEEGFSKKDVQEYLWHSLQRTVQDWKESYSYEIQLKQNIFPAWYKDLSSDVVLPKFGKPENIVILVVGGENNLVYQAYEGVGPARGVTKSIDKWKK
ncbi:MAG: hypothetical protein NUK65_11910, partial [Firmicutes bacterium]|nr:hypothetical protein [Bacillota bacterium]